ncbi:hypothetical protein PIB30_046518 [Stylosanthes scabra]|uniref:Uncharacterized protein n=1 Tax=Stylosanthes scabra TaxID=79078 RepID=A0ABU6ZF84_9FABA|nr:hypothetical protein [Stylosanthes scabra]
MVSGESPRLGVDAKNISNSRFSPFLDGRVILCVIHLGDHHISQRVSSSSPAKAITSFCHQMAGKMVKPPMCWEVIPPSECWMCDEDEEVEKGEDSVKKKGAREEKEEEDQEEEEEEVPAAVAPLPMDVDAD